MRFVIVQPIKKLQHITRIIRDFILIHFQDIVNNKKYSQIMVLPNLEQMQEILGHERLNVKYEDEVFDTVFEWIQEDNDTRHPLMAEMLSQVQLELITNRQVLVKTLADPYVMHCPRSAEMMQSAVDYHNLSKDKKTEYWKTREKPKRWPKLLAVLSYAEKIIEYFDFQKENWSILTEKPDWVFGAELAYSHGKLYTIGGVQSKQVEQFDPESVKWRDDFPALRHFRHAHGVGVSKEGYVYVVGGSANASGGGPGLTAIEWMDPGCWGCDWTLSSPMSEGRSFMGVTCDDKGLVYVVGGDLSETKGSTVEIYNQKNENWGKGAKTLQKRDSCRLASIDERVYAIGGYDNNADQYLSSIEVYDPSTNEWTLKSPMKVGRRSPGVVQYKGFIYAVGGMGQGRDLDSIEQYNATTDTWRLLPKKMREISGWVSVALIDKPVRMMAYRKPSAKRSSNMICTAAMSEDF